MVPSDCFSSTMKKDRHVVSGIKPEETDPCSNTRKKKTIEQLKAEFYAMMNSHKKLDTFNVSIY